MDKKRQIKWIEHQEKRLAFFDFLELKAQKRLHHF